MWQSMMESTYGGQPDFLTKLLERICTGHFNGSVREEEYHKSVIPLGGIDLEFGFQAKEASISYDRQRISKAPATSVN